MGIQKINKYLNKIEQECNIKGINKACISEIYGKTIAVSLGISEYIIGLTLIAFGTSFPEFVVSINASILNESDIVFGNIIGSNIDIIALFFSFCTRTLSRLNLGKV